MADKAEAGQAIELKDFGMGGEGDVNRWTLELKSAEKTDKKWIKRADKVVARYRDERESADNNSTKINILWANTNTIIPSLYARTPNPQVNRRFKQKDAVARQVAQVLERTAAYAVDMCDFDAIMLSAIQDYQLPGRAVTRVFYKPKMVKKRILAQPISYEQNFEPNINDPLNPIAVQGNAIYAEGVEQDEKGAYTMEDRMEYEDVEPGTVFWKDFRMGKARHWRQVPWVAFRSYLTRKELEDRFKAKLGDEGIKQIPLDYTPQDMDEETVEATGSQLLKKAEVWEVWDKISGKVSWICPGFKHSPLDKKDPHLKLRGFYPCTRPLVMTETTSTMVPVPEYIQYQDQAKELDLLTTRINILIAGIRVSGAYDANASGLDKMLTDSSENKLYPISNWAKFMDGGGFEKAIAWLPIGMMVQVLQVLYESRAQVKQDIYEVTGISDIIRGASNPNETASAQKIKGRFASMRLTAKQNLIAEHARQIISLMTEIQAEQFDPATLSKISGIEVTEQMSQMMKDEPMRQFAVKVETDSTVQPDQAEEQRARVEFLTAAGSFIKQAIEVVQADPNIQPLMSEMLMFGVRGFKAGRDLEGAFEEYIEEAKNQREQEAQNPPEQQEDPEVLKSKMEAQFAQDKHQAEIKRDQEKHNLDMQQLRDKNDVEIIAARRKANVAA